MSDINDKPPPWLDGSPIEEKRDRNGGRRGGRRPGSGRKSAEKHIKLDGDEVPPILEPTFESVNRHAAWVARALAAGKIPPAVARELTQAQRTILMGLNTSHRQTEMDNLRQMVDEAKRALEERKGLEVRARHGSNTADGGSVIPIYSGRIEVKD